MADRPGGGTLGERLSRRRVERFVGRQAERELFESALDGEEQACPVLFVHGPAGVGKSSLLGWCSFTARARQLEVAVVDGRSTPATTNAVLAALEDLAPNRARAVAADRRADPVVVLVDAYEQLDSLDEWFREALLPGLPGRSVVVVAGRRPPSVAWRADPAWRDLLRIVSLRNLAPEESRCYLIDSGVPADRCDRLIELTYGHPMALALVADVTLRGGDPGVEELTPDVVSALVRRLADDVPSPGHGRALEVCAIARVTTEPLLRDVLLLDDAQETFDWLAELPFVDLAPDGLAPHDLARDVLDIDLRWRDRTTYDEVFRRVRAHVHARLRTRTGLEQQRAIFDEKFVFRNLPSVLSPVDWTSWGDAYPQRAVAGDRAEVLEMIRLHEGDEPASIAARWWDEQPDAFHVVRHGGRVQGALVLLTMAEPPSFDPGARAAWSHAARTAAPRPGELVTQTRFVVDRDRYQAPSPTLNATPVLTMQRYLRLPNLSWDYLTLREPDGFDAYFAIAGLPRATGADFLVGGRRYGLFAHDFRRVPVNEWLEVVTERALAQDVAPPAQPSEEPVVLSQPDFFDAVRRALRDLHRADLLARNPLCRTRLVRSRADASPAMVLADLLCSAADDLRSDSRDEKRWRAIDRTYLRPAATQELAAQVLDLPFSTYRRQLAEGVDRVVARLWELELYGSSHLNG